MRIAWIHSFPPEHGQRGAPMVRLASLLERRGHSLRVLSTGPLTSPRRLSMAVRRLSHEASGADIIHALDGSACAFVASSLPGRKVLSVRGSDWYDRRLHSWMGRRLTRMSLRLYDLVLTASERMRGEILDCHPDLHVEALPSGIDLAELRPMPAQEARARLGVTDDAPWALFAQPSRPLKRFALAQAAISLARREIPDLRLVCIEGKPIPEVRHWINASSAVLLTSTHEGWPKIVKEGLACGVPFTSTDVSDLKDISQVEPACRVTDDNAESLAKGLLESLRHGRSERLRLHATRFDLRATADRLVHWYSALSSRPRVTEVRAARS